MDKRFNIRVYGIFIHNGSLLLTDEYRMGMEMTKFPGGGMEFGEGPEDCIRRECLEEFGQEFEIGSHFYTTGFFQESAFNKNHQLISIYYMVKPLEELRCKVCTQPFLFEKKEEGAQIFRWKKLGELIPEDLTFPVDRIVAEKLIEMYRKKEL